MQPAKFENDPKPTGKWINIRKVILEPLSAQCIFSEDTGFWLCPDTGDAQTKLSLWQLDWQQMIGRSDIKSIVPKFYPQEADHNQRD